MPFGKGGSLSRKTAKDRRNKRYTDRQRNFMDLTPPSQDEPTNQVLMPPSVGDLPEQRQPVPDVSEERRQHESSGRTHTVTHSFLFRQNCKMYATV